MIKSNIFSYQKIDFYMGRPHCEMCYGDYRGKTKFGMKKLSILNGIGLVVDAFLPL